MNGAILDPIVHAPVRPSSVRTTEVGLLLVGLGFCLGATSHAAQVTRLSGAMVEGGDVRSVAVSSDGGWVVYTADQELDEAIEIYAVPRDGSAAPVKLNPPVPAGWNVWTFAIAAGDSRVVFPLTGPDEAGIYSAALDGSAAAVRLDPALVDTTHAQLWFVAGGRALFTVEHGAPPILELYSSPLDGSVPAVRLNPPATPLPPDSFGNPRGVNHLVLHPDGARVAFTMINLVAEDGTYLAAIDGSSSAISIHADPLPIFSWLVSEDDRLLFVRRVGSGFPFNQKVFSKPLDAAATATLLSPGMTTSWVHAGDGNVLFLGAPSGSSQSSALLSVPSDGSAPARQIDAAPQGFGFGVGVVAPDNVTIAYHTVPPERLFTVRWLESAHGPRVRRAGPEAIEHELPVGLALVHGAFRFGPDGKRLLVQVASASGVHEIFSVHPGGRRPPVRLNGPLVPGGGVLPSAHYFESDVTTLRTDGRRVVYVADQDTADVVEIYEAPIDGGRLPTRVNAPLAPGGDVLGPADSPLFELTPDGNAVVYVADQDLDGVHELFVAELLPIP